MADEPKEVTPESVKNPPPPTVIDPTAKPKPAEPEHQKLEPDFHHERDQHRQ